MSEDNRLYKSIENDKKSLFINTKLENEEDYNDIENIKKRKSFLNNMFNKLKNSVYNIFSPKSL